MDASFMARLKEACGLTEGDSFLSDESDDETYNPEDDPNVTALLFGSDSSDESDILSDDSAVVDLRKVCDVAKGVNSGVSVMDVEAANSNCAQMPSTSHDVSRQDVTRTHRRQRRKTYEKAMELIAATNAFSDDDSEGTMYESDADRSETEDSDDELSGETDMSRRKKMRVSTSTGLRRGGGTAAVSGGVSRRGRGGRQTQVVGGHGDQSRCSSSTTVTVERPEGRKRGDKVEQTARYYDERPSVGSRRYHAGPEGGATQNGIFYGPGILSEDDFMQPRDRTYPAVKIMPEGYSWRGRPKRQPMSFEFKPKRQPGVHHMKAEWTCTEMFEALWNECEQIWRNATNAKGREICAKTGGKFREVTKVDTYAFVACKLWIDLFRKPSLQLYWCEVLDYCSPFMIRARRTTGMSHRRFRQIKVWSRLYDKELASSTGMNNPTSLNYDVSHKAREYLDAMNRSCEKCMEPDEIISFDESMLEYTGIGGEKQTIRSKPIPTGLMFYAACTRRGYFLRTLLHAKQTLPYWQEMGVPFATVWSVLSGALCSGMTNYLDTGRTLITDRAYTSVSLAYALAFRSTYFIGTTKRNLKCVPDCLVKESVEDGRLKTVNKSSKHSMSRGDSYFLHDTAGVVSFCVWQDNKAVPLLYTTRTVEELTICKRLVKGGSREGKEFTRPLILNEYDAGMGGVDIGDQHISAQHRPTRCFVWYTPILFRSFDVLCNNVFCVKQMFGHQMPMLSVKLSIAYGMLQKAQLMAGTFADGSGMELLSTDIHNPYSVKSAQREPCVACGRRATTGCETCAKPCHLDDCWKTVHASQ